MLSKISNLLGVAAFTIAAAAGATLATSATSAAPAMADWHQAGWCGNHPHDSHCYHPMTPHCGRHYHLHHGHCVHD